MKLLKYRYPFGGYELISGVTAACAFITSILTSNGIIRPERMPAAFILSDIIALSIAIYISQHLSAEEKQRIAETPLSLWEPATPEILRRVRSLPVHPWNLVCTLLCFVFSLPLVLNIYRISGEEKNVYTAMGAVLLAVLIVMILVSLFFTMLPVIWRNADESTVYTMLEISRVYSIRRRKRYSFNRRDYYAVCYSSEGRFRLKIAPEEEHAAHIIVVKCGSLITYFTDADTDPISIMRKTGIVLPFTSDTDDDAF